MFAGKKSAQIREILISESTWEEMTCLFAPSQEQTTFSQILLDARMQHAKNLIRVEGSVNKIAEQCGYASTSYFIYAFRKHFGNSPKRVSKEYRCQSHTGMNTGNTMSALAI